MDFGSLFSQFFPVFSFKFEVHHHNSDDYIYFWFFMSTFQSNSAISVTIMNKGYPKLDREKSEKFDNVSCITHEFTPCKLKLCYSSMDCS